MNTLWERLHTYEPLWEEWNVERQIYSGGNSCVFLLTRRRFEKTLRSVLKVIEVFPSGSDSIEAQLSRALDEIERMEILGRSNAIVPLLDDSIREVRDEAGALRGYDVLLRMEYMTCLADQIRDGETLREEEVVRIAGDMCAALAFAHERGFVHRDIKPANIYRTELGTYRLGDFGVSGRATGAAMLTTITGTTAYMAPEVARGEPYGKEADIYSLGVVLYQLLNDNFLPFTDANSTYSERERAMRSRWNGARLPAPKHGSKRLQAAVLRALSAQPDRRYATADEMRRAIRGRGNMRAALQASAGAALCLACLALGAGASAFWLSGRQAPLPPQEDALPADAQQSGAQAQLPAAPVQEETVPESRYEVVKLSLTWEDAKVYCESRAGHLATITSRREETKIIALLEKSGLEAAWIGANNRNSSKGFRWVTDERFSYAAWGLNEPNNTNGVEYYLMLMYKEDQGWVWNDSRDTGLEAFDQSKVGFVCEWEENE